jgi:hypothetical protein
MTKVQRECLTMAGELPRVRIRADFLEKGELG